MADGARVQVSGVRYSYPEAESAVLTDVSLAVDPGAVHAIMGGNGAGKTTLLRLIAGLREPDAGAVEIESGSDPVVGYASENPKDGFFAESVGEELAYFPENRGLDVQERVEDALEAMDVAHLRDRLPLSLSGGEQRMVSIASVLAGDPAVLALDEPTTHLHRHAERRLGEVCTDLDRTVLFSTHDPDFAFEYADRVSVLRDGRIVRTGTPKEVLTDIELLAGAGIRVPGIVEWAEANELGSVPASIEAAIERGLE